MLLLGRLTSLLLAVASATAAERGSFQVNCDGNLEIGPPAGGAVEIGKILLKTDGVIESDQMQLIADTLARLETGLAAASADIQVLTANNTALVGQVDGLHDNVVTLTADNSALNVDNVALQAANAALKSRVDGMEAAAASDGDGKSIAPLVVNGDREPLPNCDASTNPGQQVTALWDDGNSSEVCVCTVSPGGHGRWSTVASEIQTALKIGSGNTEVHGGMPGGRHNFMCDTSALHTNVYIRRPTIFVGHPTVGQVPEVYVGARIIFSSQTHFETQGCVIKTQEYISLNTLQHVKLALNNPIPKEGFKQALEISRGVLAPGKYQIDVPFPTHAQVSIAGAVELIGVSAGGEAVAVGLSFKVLDGGVLTTSGIIGFNGLSIDRGGEARIGISNPTPQNNLLQSLIFKGTEGRTVLQPGKYQVDAPVDMISTWRIQEDGDVFLVGSVGGTGSFKGVKWEITNGQLMANLVEFGGPTGGVDAIASGSQQGYAKFTNCHFNKDLSNGPMIKTSCQPYCSSETARVNVDVEESTFDGILAQPVYVAAPGTVTLKNCNVQNFRQPLTAYGGGLSSSNKHNVKLVINGGSISNFFDYSGRRGALLADYGHISISGVTFINNDPQNCEVDTGASGKIVGTGC